MAKRTTAKESEIIEAKPPYTLLNFPYGKLIQIAKAGEQSVGVQGYSAVLNYIRMQKLPVEPLSPVFEQPSNYTDYEKLVNWTTKQGVLPRRISKAYHDAGTELSQPQVAEIGNILNRNIMPSVDLWLRIVREITWSRGTFGDDNSCIMNSSSGNFANLKMGGMGVQIWTRKDGTGAFTGVARCWLFPYDQRIFLHNAYSKGGYPVTLTTFGNALAILFGLPNNRRGFSHNGLYVNGHVAQVLGEDKPQQKPKNGLANYHYATKTWECKGCHKTLISQSYGDDLCQDCILNAKPCPNCKTVGMKLRKLTSNKKVVCEHCSNYCWRCYKVTDKKTKMTESAGGNPLCPACVKKSTPCDKCKKPRVTHSENPTCVACRKKEKARRG